MPRRRRGGAAARLTALGGTLYGTTGSGGTGCGFGCGTIFTIAPSGQHTVVREMRVLVGAQPGRLTKVGESLYGEAITGGPNGLGSIFKFRPDGGLRLIYAFQGGADGANPAGGPLNLRGVLYGTTTGISGERGAPLRNGTVFRITPDGTLTTLHTFDCAAPRLVASGLLAVGSTLYGAAPACDRITSVIYKIAPDGTYSVLHTFAGYEGFRPNGDLIRIGDLIYGTTYEGGRYGYGTIYQMTLMGRLKVLFDFPRTSKYGLNPNSGLTELNGKFYGTTTQGGADAGGTVYFFTP